MDAGQKKDLLGLLKALADENRLTMVGLMSKQERNVGELAGLLNLSEPTVSHHIGKLHEFGLLHLRMAGNQRFYRINEKRLAKFKTYAQDIEKALTEPSEQFDEDAWLESLDITPEDKKVLREYTANGKLTDIPMKQKKLLAVLRWLVTKFEMGAHYTEKEVNAIIKEVHPDYASLRRNLIEFGFMRRERGGGDYWLTPEDEPVP